MHLNFQWVENLIETIKILNATKLEEAWILSKRIVFWPHQTYLCKILRNDLILKFWKRDMILHYTSLWPSVGELVKQSQLTGNSVELGVCRNGETWSQARDDLGLGGSVLLRQGPSSLLWLWRRSCMFHIHMLFLC